VGAYPSKPRSSMVYM